MNPELHHEWSIDADEDHCWLTIPKLNEAGFDVLAEVWPDEITVFGEGAHVHLLSSQGIEDAVGQATGLIRDLLSAGMREIEFRSNGRAYRWALEVQTSAGWKLEHETWLFFWNYFGRRSTRILQNHHLPIREKTTA